MNVTNFRWVVVTAALTLAAACADTPLASPPSGPLSEALPESGGNGMQGYTFDAPVVQKWDTNAAALHDALVLTSGRVIVGFRAPGAVRARASGGRRAAMSANDIQQALASVAVGGASVVQTWPQMGLALLEIPPESAGNLLTNPFVDFVAPDRPQPLGRDGTVATGSARSLPSARTASKSVVGGPTGPAASLYGDPELDANWGLGVVHGAEAWPLSTGATDRVMLISYYGVELGQIDLPAIPVGNCGGTFGSCNGPDSFGWHGNVKLGPWMALHNGVDGVGVAPGILGSNVYSWRVSAPFDSTWDYQWAINGLYAAVNQGIGTVDLAIWSNELAPI